MINKSKLLYTLYFTKNTITIIMRISIKKKKIITLINREKTNTMTITLIKKIKDFLKTKCKLNLKKKNNEKNIYKHQKKSFKNQYL